VVPDFGSGKSKIQPFFRNLAKSGSGQIHSGFLLDWADTSAAAVNSVNWG